MTKLFYGALGALPLLIAAPAQADVQLWNQAETKVVLPPRPGLPDAVSFETDVRYSDALVGLERVQLRWGPRWRLWDFLDLGVNHVAYLQQPSPGSFIQEQRLELQPTFDGQIGRFIWVDRNRLEYRWRPESQRVRYRNQLRVETAVAPGWTPFLSDEVFFDLGGAGLNENRIGVGLAHEVAGAGWEVGYTLRTRLAEAPWAHDHLITVAWFNALQRAPLFAGQLTEAPAR